MSELPCAGASNAVTAALHLPPARAAPSAAVRLADAHVLGEPISRQPRTWRRAPASCRPQCADPLVVCQAPPAREAPGSFAPAAWICRLPRLVGGSEARCATGVDECIPCVQARDVRHRVTTFALAPVEGGSDCVSDGGCSCYAGRARCSTRVRSNESPVCVALSRAAQFAFRSQRLAARPASVIRSSVVAPPGACELGSR